MLGISIILDGIILLVVLAVLWVTNFLTIVDGLEQAGFVTDEVVSSRHVCLLMVLGEWILFL